MYDIIKPSRIRGEKHMDSKEIIVAMADNDKKRTKELMEDFDYRFAYKYLYPNDSQSAKLYVDNNPGLKDRREEEYNWFLQGNVE